MLRRAHLLVFFLHIKKKDISDVLNKPLEVISSMTTFATAVSHLQISIDSVVDEFRVFILHAVLYIKKLKECELFATYKLFFSQFNWFYRY